MNDIPRQKQTGWNIFLGALLLLLGIVTLFAQFFTTLASIYFLGWVLLIGGFLEFFNGFFPRENRWLYLIGGVLSFIFGYILITNPLNSAVFLTLLIGIWLALSGTFKLIASMIVHEEKWGLKLFSGILTLLLGIVILSQWPVSGLWVVGLFIGIELIIRGISLMGTQAYQPATIRRSHDNPYFTGAKGGKAQRRRKNS